MKDRNRLGKFLVWNASTGNVKVAHGSLEEAETEALRLARKSNTPFVMCVLQVVSQLEEIAPVERSFVLHRYLRGG